MANGWRYLYIYILRGHWRTVESLSCRGQRALSHDFFVPDASLLPPPFSLPLIAAMVFNTYGTGAKVAGASEANAITGTCIMIVPVS